MAGNASGIKAGRAFVEVGTDETKLDKGLKSAEDRVKGFGGVVLAVGVQLKDLAHWITAPFTEAPKQFAEAGAALTNMSARTGVSVEALSTLSYAALQTGTDIGMVEGGIRKMSKALTAGSEENMQAQVTFASLGLSIQQLMRL